MFRFTNLKFWCPFAHIHVGDLNKCLPITCPIPEVFMARLNRALNNLVQGKVPLPLKGELELYEF